jgi:hypothetical protein
VPWLAPAPSLRESGRSFRCSSCALESGFAPSFSFNLRQVLRRMTAPTTTSTNATAPPMPPAMALVLLELATVVPVSVAAAVTSVQKPTGASVGGVSGLQIGVPSEYPMSVP